MDKKWYYAENGAKAGPFSIKELAGKVKPETLVWKEGMTDWTKAENLKEFEHLFSKNPPPIPDVESFSDKKTKHLNRIVDSVFYGWFLLALTIVIGFLDYTENNEGKIYGILVFMTMTASIRVLLGLKSYLSNILNFKQATININWLIATSIPIYLFWALESRLNLESRFSEDELMILNLIIFAILLLLVFHSLSLAVKLFKVEDSSIGALKAFAFLQIVSLGFTLGYLFFGDEENNYLLPETFLELISLVFLVIALKKIRDKYVPLKLYK